jgi:hypothetical protein
VSDWTVLIMLMVVVFLFLGLVIGWWVTGP